MKSRQIMFFATLADLQPILKSVEESTEVHYFQTGLFDDPNIKEYESAFSMPHLGTATKGDWNQIESYMVMPRTISPKIRDIPQRKGGVKYAVDLAVNPGGAEVKPGGVFTEKENVLVAGRIGIISESDFASSVYKLFSSRIKKEFKKIGAFYVGKEAEEKLKSGWRLVTDEGSPKGYDLAFL